MLFIIRVEQIKVWAYHGVYPEEKKIGRYFLVDVELEVELEPKAVLIDDLSSTYNYEHVVRIVEEEMKISCDLLEKKSLEMALKIKESDSKVQQVRLRLTKLQPPFKTEVEATSVEILI